MTGAPVYGISLGGRWAAALTLGLLCMGCLTAPVSDLVVPDWVLGGGRTPRFPHEAFATGYARAGREEGLAVVKTRAAADLASQLEVRIEHELRDVSEERDGVYAYHVASVTRATVELSLGGLHYETFATGSELHVLAWIEREAGALRRRAALARALVEVETCLASGRRHEDEGSVLAAAQVYERCRLPLVAGLEHSAVVGALTEETLEDRAAHRTLSRAAQEIDTRCDKIFAQSVASLSQAADALALQLLRQGVTTEGTLRVEAFQYGTADVSSSFGRQLALELEGAIARHAASAPEAAKARALVVRGVYLEDTGLVRLHVIVKESVTLRLVASAATSLPIAAVPAMLSLKPGNFEAALQAQRVLGGGSEAAGDLRLELWTTDGRRALVYSEGESYEIFLRANRPAWVRLVYVLQSGEQVPLEWRFRIDESQVGQVVRYPRRFQVIAPFGVEHFHATAFTEPPAVLPTRRTRIAGEFYEIVTGGLDSIERARSDRHARGTESAEAFIAVTTTSRESWR